MVVAHVHGLTGQWHFGFKDFRVKTKTAVHLAGGSSRHDFPVWRFTHRVYALTKGLLTYYWERGPVSNTYVLWSVFVGLTSERKRKPSRKEARRRRREEGFGPTDRSRNSRRVFPCLNRFNTWQVFEHYGNLLIDVFNLCFLWESECFSECFGAGSFVTDRVVVVISKKIVESKE